MPGKTLGARTTRSGQTDANLNTRFYERIAPIYDSLYEDVDAEEAVRQWRLLVKRQAGLPKPGDPTLPRLLDLGCGTGRYLDPWAAAAFSVTGVDASRSMISRARDLRKTSAWASRIRLVCCDLRKTCRVLTTGARFDIAVAHLNFFNLFPPGEIQEVLRHLASYMADGARLFTDCASPALMPEPGCERSVLGDGTAVEIITTPDPAAATVIRSYRFRRSEISEKYWLHSTSVLKAAARLAGWQLESAYAWRPNRPRAPWLPLPNNARNHRVCVFRVRFSSAASDEAS
jgi:SAM-dependent methyltransferase